MFCYFLVTIQAFNLHFRFLSGYNKRVHLFYVGGIVFNQFRCIIYSLDEKKWNANLD